MKTYTFLTAQEGQTIQLLPGLNVIDTNGITLAKITLNVPGDLNDGTEMVIKITGLINTIDFTGAPIFGFLPGGIGTFLLAYNSSQRKWF